MLTERVTKYFDGAVRGRGEAYAKNGSVTRVNVRGNKARAVVHGSDQYRVRIERDSDGSAWWLHVACTCPYAEDNDDRCKHVWAVLRAGEAKMESAWGTPPKTVEVHGQDGDDPGFDSEDYEDEESNEAEEVAPQRPIATRKEIASAPIAQLRAEIERLKQRDRARNAKPAQPAKPQIPAWKRMLEETRAYVRNSGTFSPAARGKQEIVIDRVWT